MESENKTTDDGHTHVKSVHANIEGRYDVDGGKGQFAAVDHHKEAVTEYQDDNSSLKRNETSSNTAAREHVVRKTDDGTQVSSTTSSSTSTSKFQQMSSTKHDTVPYLTNDDYDLRSYDTNRNDDTSSVTRRQITKTNDFEQNLRKNEYEHSTRKNDYEQNVTRNDYETGELVSRKIDYPDDNTRVIVETRCLPDGTRVTSTKREFRAPVQSTRSEHHYQTRENKSYSTQQRSDARESSKVIRHVIDNTDIVDSQRNVDDYDFKRQIADYTKKDTEDYSDVQRYETKVNKKVIDHSKVDDDYSQTMRHVTRVNKVTESTDNDDYVQSQYTKQTNQRKYDVNDNRRETVTLRDDRRETVTQRDDYRDTITPRDDRRDTGTPREDRCEPITPRDDLRDTVSPREDHREPITPRDDRRDTVTPRDDRRDTVTPRDNLRDTVTPRNDRREPVMPRNDPRETISQRDDRPVHQNDVHQQTKSTEERIHHITRDKKVEEIVDRKTSTDQYQTTYQTDYPKKKISNDWSPSHQAWTSTLRADTPSTTRPSTRASSPGSKTFKSSTSSVRSSVSPDKTFRKPSSRGNSPNKIDRSSPTRSVSDRHSTSHSTYSITDIKTNKYNSPDDRRPPTGRSPTRPGYSPDRKPQDHRQRPSVSPEKRPQDLYNRPSASPERKPHKASPTDGHPRTGSPTRPVDRHESPTRPRASPERKPTPSSDFPHPSPNRSNMSPERTYGDGYPKDTSKRPSQSPDSKPGFQKPTDGRSSPTSDYPRSTPTSLSCHPTDNNKRPSTSPDRKPGYQPSRPAKETPDKPTEKYPKNSVPHRGSVSPDRKPGYMRPSSANTPSDNLKSPRKPSGRTSPTKYAPTESPDRKPQDNSKTTKKIQEDHYKFIDEETKIYTHTDKTDTDYLKYSSPEHPTPRDKSSSPSRKSPSKDTPDFRDTKLPRKRSPSPKEQVTFIDQRDRVDTTQLKTTDITEEKTTIHSFPKDTPIDKTAPKEPSPSKYGTYDKKKPYDHDLTEVTKTTIKDTKYDSLTRRENSPKKTPDQPSSPTKKSPRDSVSPIKSPPKDTKYKQTTDFLSTERTTEVVNQKTSKERPRQLLTPSSSPTRKPKHVDTELSTGQSSPTTSVSGFVYFSSPRTEKTVITDLDDQEDYSETHKTDETTTTFKRPESLDVKRSSSPTKVPCRSPSPEKCVSPSKDNILPRKSSLKKPSTEITQASPIEKPPSSFRVSPTEEPKDFPEHHVLKKDRPVGPENDVPVGKPKPPLERRETYEDRCRKILGMMVDTTTSETVKQTSYLKEPETNLSSPSLSPCHSPIPRETPFEYPSTKKITDTKADVTNFITREQENIVKTTTTRRDEIPADKKPKTPREHSPTKLQDSITKEKTVVEYDVKTTDNVKATVKTNYPSPRQSPERKPSYQPADNISKKSAKDNISKARESPEPSTPRALKDSGYPYSDSPSKPSGTSPRSSSSPERKPGYKPSDEQPGHKYPKEQTPELTPGNMKTTSVTSSSYNTTTEDCEEIVTSKSFERKPLQSSDSLTRKAPSDKPKQPSDKSPQRKPENEQPTPTKARPERKSRDDYPRETSPRTPNYTKTTSMITEYDCTSTTENVEKSTASETVKNRHTSSLPSESPTRKASKPLNDAPTRLSYPSDKSPQRKPTHDQPSPIRASPEKRTGDKPKESSPTRPGYMKITASMTTKCDTISTENIHETTLSESVKTRYKSSQPAESPTRDTAKPSDGSPSRPANPVDKNSGRKAHGRDQNSPTRASPEKKSGDKYPKETSPTRSKPVNDPGYMKPASSVLSEYEISSSKTTEIRHPRRPSESPTRKSPKPDDYPRTSSPSRPSQPADKNTERRPKHETSPTRASANKQPGVKNPKEQSPSRQKPNTEKSPGYMKTTSSNIYKKDTTSTTENVLETNSTQTYEKQYRPSDSPTRRPLNPGNKSVHEPDYSQAVSPTRPDLTESILSKHSVSPDRKLEPHEPFEPNTRRLTDKRRKGTSPSRESTSPDTPGYTKTISTVTTKHDSTDDTEEFASTKTVHNRFPTSQPSKSPSKEIIKPDEAPRKPHLDRSPNRKTRYNEPSPRSSPERPIERSPKESSPSRPISDKGSAHLKTTTSVISTYDSTAEDIQKTKTSRITENRHPTSRPLDSSPTRKASKPTESSKSTPDAPRTESPLKLQPDTPGKKTSEAKNSPSKTSGDIYPRESSPTRTATEENESAEDVERNPSPRSTISPSRRSPDQPSKLKPGYLQQPEEPRQLRTPSPTKKSTKVTEVSTDFLMSEREQEILDRVQKSLRKLSPERKEKSATREKSPGKTTTSLQDIDITNHTIKDDDSTSEYVTEYTEKYTTSKTDTYPLGKSKDEKPKDQKVPSKPSSRTVSPMKKPSGIATLTKADKSPDTLTKTRSISPKKTVSPTERPQSPQVSRPSGIRPKEHISSHLTRKATPAALTITKVEKTVTDLRKTTGVTSITKQNSFTRTTTTKTPTKTIPSPTSRPSEHDTRRTPTPKGIRESVFPTKKDSDTKVTRTVSDITMKSKKTSPQRMKSKPEIQVSDMSTTKTTTKAQKSTSKEPQSKLPSKPKSATTLNTSTDEDDVIIDVQQSKSSRENSPDRICPTPVNFAEDVGTPRYPDEVSEPDDEFRRRTHHTIHEAESIVDDIVEICEDDELFVRKTDIDIVTEDDESLLSVTDKVSRFAKGVDTAKKPKDATTFKDTERRVHSDYIDEKLKSDECLLSVSEKVNKFAKGPRDSKSPSRRVVDEYDKNTVYQDDYTKLSVHDKAHLFVETAENVKTPKVKATPQRVERPDLTNIDDSLKSDDCLLSVSDKVHKFVKTAEQFFTETHEVEEKEKKIKEQHDKIMKRIVDDADSADKYEVKKTTVIEDVEVTDRAKPHHRDEKPAFPKETPSHVKVKENRSPNHKPTERTPTVKITTLRSSEAVKKAKALFENIASTTQKTKETAHTKTAKLTDIGVLKKSPKTDSTTVLHPSVEDGSPYITDVESEVDAAPHTPKERPSSGTLTRPHHSHPDDKPRISPSRVAVHSPDVTRCRAPVEQILEVTNANRSTRRAESPRQQPENDKGDKIPGYLRPTKTSQIKEETKIVEEPEVSSRRGSGKFGVELRRTSIERSTVSSERRRSVEHPCIEDIFDLDLLEQMVSRHKICLLILIIYIITIIYLYIY